MSRLTLDSFNEFIDEKIKDFICELEDNSKTVGYHNSCGQGMDIGWIDCARYIKDVINEEFLS